MSRTAHAAGSPGAGATGGRSLLSPTRLRATSYALLSTKVFSTSVCKSSILRRRGRSARAWRARLRPTSVQILATQRRFVSVKMVSCPFAFNHRAKLRPTISATSANWKAWCDSPSITSISGISTSTESIASLHASDFPSGRFKKRFIAKSTSTSRGSIFIINTSCLVLRKKIRARRRAQMQAPKISDTR